ncbi:PREDICTED: cAMP-responsive element modulator [Crocodylus porosus]|uniref:cAMP-responsive element modulator n=1 Tax=Crocodylus porosus TaxID=8502 RepID=UPI00093B9E8F|nr:PREDICTED: cAMP-responsive element modulator [Crocodylus porosus]
MSKCVKKYHGKITVRQMTMEMVESQQDGSAAESAAESDAVRMQNPPGQSQIPPIAQVSVAGSSAGRGSPAVTLVQLASGQTVHVQGVIQATQPSVIQSPQMQAVQVAPAANADESAESEGVIDSQKRREILSRRPSYRKILNELSSDVPGVPKIEEEKSEEEGAPSGIPAMGVPTSLYQTSTGQYIAIAQGGAIQISNPASDSVQGLQTLTMTNSGAPQPGATIVQYAAQTPDGTQQFFVPGSQVVVQAATGAMPFPNCERKGQYSLVPEEYYGDVSITDCEMLNYYGNGSLTDMAQGLNERLPLLQIWKHEQLPSVLRDAKIVTIFKKGDR